MELLYGAFYEFLDEQTSVSVHEVVDDLYQDFSEYMN